MEATLLLLFVSATSTFNLPQGLLSALCFVESSHRVEAMHKDDGGSNSIGVCQIKYTTAKELGFKGTSKDLRKPEVNIYYAAKYLAKQIKKYHSVDKGIVAYNLGHYSPTYTVYLHKVTKARREKR